ncbi:MAG TPA: PQQ-dependent sugar dehydrogenase [Polyangia bacterium]
MFETSRFPTVRIALLLALATSCGAGASSPSGENSGAGGGNGAKGGSEGSSSGGGRGGSNASGSGGSSSNGGSGSVGTGGTSSSGGGAGGTSPAGTGGARADAASETGGGTADAATPDAGAAACAAGAPFPTLRQMTVGMANGPIHLVGDPSDPSTAYVLERGGRVRVLKDGMLGAPIITMTGVVTDGERGALGMALHPQFKDNGRVFIFMTKPATTVEEWKIAGGMATRVKELYSFPHSSGYHQGGTVAFGPDNMLYISVGENHSGGNAPQANGRLGRVMRVDPDTGMPPATGNLMGYTWSHGLRNPYRISFDRLTGDLYIADVGQGAQEEIDFEPKGQGGKNYGWPAAEGTAGNGGVRPIHTYGRSGGNAIIGGHVYRGSKYPCLHGHYFYADNGSNQVRSLVVKDGAATDHKMHAPLSGNAGGSIWSFGEDGAGELYLLRSGGRITRIEAN